MAAMGRNPWSGRVSKAVRDNMRPDSPGAVAERIAFRQDAERAVREREAKFGTLNVDNAQAASDWQEARIKELQAVRREAERSK